jgi:hypothetical protein
MSAESSAQEYDPSLLERLFEKQRDGWGHGERPLVEALVAAEPALADDRDGLLELVCNELDLRARAGETPQLEEYGRRFPGLGDSSASSSRC